ncbi:MAG: hypothetical protein FJ087_01205 [Deltaproteobacteria bacterium]|nr:hypothetical protein [Deltaproteobacteria bacterium]
MHRSYVVVLALVVAAAAAVAPAAGCSRCTRGDVVPSVEDAPGAVAALRESRFDEAERLALEQLAREDRNAAAHAVAALTRFKRVAHQAVTDVIAIGGTAIVAGRLNQQYLDFAVDQADDGLADVERHLAAAARDPGFALELCLACWKVDWNHDGRIDDRDARMLEVEVDADGHEYPEDDPRRTPTFRFDAGDLHWARAMVAFQRAVLAVLSAYEAPDFAGIVRGGVEDKVFRIRMRDRAAVHRARDLVLAGIGHADRCRREYLAETDDDREWVPNPRQKSHPLPLPVDEALYATWEGVLEDVRRLVKGDEGLSVVDVAQLGDHAWKDPPQGFVDVGRLFEQPGDIVIDSKHLETLDRDEDSRSAAEAVLKDVFGDKYRTGMAASRLPSRLARMKKEMDRGEETFERKLRYLLWLN